MGLFGAAPRRAGFRAVAIIIGVGGALGASLLTPNGAHAAESAASPAPHGASKLPGYEVLALGRGNYNRLCLPVTVDGKKGLLAIDTGASNTVLSAGKYGFLLQGEDHKLPEGVPTKTRVRDTSMRLASIHNFQIGSIKVSGFPLFIAGQRYFHDAEMLYAQSANYDYDGLVGEEILRHFNAIIDCGRAILYLNTDPTKKTHLEAAMAADGWTRVPISDAGRNITVPCTLAGHRFNLMVDTGAPFTHLDSVLLGKTHIGTRDIGMRGGLIGDRVASREDLVLSDSIQIGDYTANNVHMMASQGLSESFAKAQDKTASAPLLGLLGGDILGRNGAIIDIGGHNLYLKRPGSTAEKKP